MQKKKIEGGKEMLMKMEREILCGAILSGVWELFKFYGALHSTHYGGPK